MTTDAPFPFIIGAGRSGTTLLRAMLDSHSAMAIPGETYLLDQLARRRDRFVRDGRFDRAAFEDELFGDTRFWSFYIERATVRAALDDSAPETLADALRVVYRCHAESVGKTRWADKTPAYAFAVDRLSTLFPEAVFIHLHRDPREVVASYLDANWSYRTAPRAAAYWALSVRGAQRARALGEHRFLEIGYRDLTNDPERSLRRICALVDLPFEASMLQYQNGRVATLGSRTDGDAHARLRERPTKRRDWADHLDAGQIRAIETVCRPKMLALGYEPRHRSSSHREKAIAFAAVRTTQLELESRNARSLNRIRPLVRRFRGVGEHSAEGQALSAMARTYAVDESSRAA